MGRDSEIGRVTYHEDEIVVCKVCKDIFLYIDTQLCCVCENCICQDCAKPRSYRVNIIDCFFMKHKIQNFIIEVYICSDECKIAFDSYHSY